MDVTEEVTATLRAEAHHPPCVMEAAGFCTEHSANARSIGYEEERSPTLRAGVVPAAIALENHPADSRVKISEDGKVQTLTSRCGTGGGNVPMVMDTVENSVESPVKEVENSPAVTLKIRSGCEGGGKGAIWQEEKSATLGCNNDQTLFVPKCYGVCSKASHSMMSDNPHSGFYEAETSRTLDRSGGDPTCNQGGICVVEPIAFTQNQRDEVRDLGEKSAALAAEPGMKQQTFVLQGNMIGRKDENGPQGDGVNEDVCFTLDATDRHAVCAPEDVYAMTTGSYMQVAKEVAPTLMARDYKDPTTIAPAPHLNEGVMGTVATGAHPSGFNGQDAFNDRLVIDNPEAQPTPVTYTVRRLTPTECARLQGFPDWWCRDLGTENPTEEELAFWADVFETHRKIVTHAKKPKTEKQIRKWLADPYTDSAEYRIWGNGIGRAIRIDAGRTGQYCRVVDHCFLDRLNREKPTTMRKLEDIWYEGNGSSWENRNAHYNSSRYHMLNLHATFTKGTIEFRLFQFADPADGKRNGLHAGEMKAYIQLCLAMSQLAKMVRTASPKPQQTDNEKYAMRCWMLRLGFIGDEFATAREILLRNMEGNASWRNK